MRAPLVICAWLIAASASAPVAAEPAEPDPRLAAARRRHPGCSRGVDADELAAAKGLHTAATHLLAEGRPEDALALWEQAYAFDCSAHRLLLNIALAEERLGHDRRAWEARALYAERSGDDEMRDRIGPDPPPPVHRPPGFRSGFGLELVIWPTTSDGTALSAVLSAQLRRDALLLELEMPFAWWIAGTPIADADGDARDGVRASLGNPMVGAHWVLPFHDGGIRLGGRIGAPLGAIDDVDWQATSWRAGQAEAWHRIGRWAAGTVPLSVGTALDWRAVAPLFLLLDLEASALFPTGRGYGLFADDRVAVALEARGGFELVAPVDGADLGGGAAAQVVWLPSVSGDAAQTAIDIWAVYRTDRFFARFGTLWALDSPLGLAFERGKVLTLHLDLGAPVD